MKSNVEVLDDNKIKISVDLEAKDVNARIKKQYKDIAKKYSFPGFRPGRAPRPVIDATYGKDAIRAMVAEDVINDLYPLAIDECGHMVVGTPTFDKKNGVVADNEDYSFTFTIGKKPEFELSSYDSVSIEMPPSGATDSEIDTQLDLLTHYYVTWEDAGADAKVADDSHVDINISAKDATGEKIEQATHENFPYSLGSALLPEAVDKEIVGMKAGESMTFEIEIEKEEDAGSFLSDYVGQRVTFDVEVKSVKREVKPEITDEWVKEKMSYDSVEDLRKLIAEQIIAEKEKRFPDMKENKCLEVLRERVNDEPPKDICEETESSLLQDFFTQLQHQGMTFDSYLASQNLTSDEFKEDVKKQARDVAVEEFAVEAWARKFDIKVEEGEVKAEFESAGLENPAKTMEEWRKAGRLHTIREALIRRKAMKDIMDGADVKIVVDTEKDADANADANATDKAKSNSKTEKADAKTEKSKTSTKKKSSEKSSSKKDAKTEKTASESSSATKKSSTKSDAKSSTKKTTSKKSTSSKTDATKTATSKSGATKAKAATSKSTVKKSTGKKKAESDRKDSK